MKKIVLVLFFVLLTFPVNAKSFKDLCKASDKECSCLDKMLKNSLSKSEYKKLNIFFETAAENNLSSDDWSMLGLTGGIVDEKTTKAFISAVTVCGNKGSATEKESENIASDMILLSTNIQTLYSNQENYKGLNKDILLKMGILNEAINYSIFTLGIDDLEYSNFIIIVSSEKGLCEKIFKKLDTPDTQKKEFVFEDCSGRGKIFMIAPMTESLFKSKESVKKDILKAVK